MFLESFDCDFKLFQDSDEKGFWYYFESFILSYGKNLLETFCNVSRNILQMFFQSLSQVLSNGMFTF